MPAHRRNQRRGVARGQSRAARPSELTSHGSRAAALLLALLATGACGVGEGGDGSRPTISPTRTPTASLPSPTGSPDGSSTPETPSPETPSPTPTADDSASPELPSPTRTPTRTPSADEAPQETPTEAEPEPEPVPVPTTEPASPDSSESAADPAGEDEAVPGWAWWLLAALVVGAAVGVPLAVRARRRGAWRQQLTSAESEVAWFAHVLLPELRQVGSLEQLAGGWAVGQTRVAAVEDRLTGLESTAPDDPGRERARSLRDAVRLARERVQRLTGPGSHDMWALDLDAVVADLEVVLGERRSHVQADGSG